jgi:holdfast attachment protein HfaA
MMRINLFGLALAAAALTASAASAQSINSYSSSFNAGWGGQSASDGNQGYAPRTGRDANGNRLIVDGVIQTGADQSSYAYSDGGGAFDKGSGAGFGASTAIGNSLNVSVIGSWNTVIVDSTQINNGDVVAGSSSELNGGLDVQ